VYARSCAGLCERLLFPAVSAAPAGASLGGWNCSWGSAGEVICCVRRLYQGPKPYHAGLLVVKAPSGALVISGVDPKSTM
jgi:hypothetical protein